MALIENCANALLHPKEFAKDKLVDALPWWGYLLILLGLNVLSILFLIIVRGFIIEVAHLDIGRNSQINLELALPIILVLNASLLLVIFATNKPFAKKIQASEYFAVSLAMFSYFSGIILTIAAVAGIISMLGLMLGTIGEIISSLTTNAASIIVSLLNVWIWFSYCTAVSEMHKTRAWKVLVILIITALVLLFAGSYLMELIFG